jgi:hypothetical protein
MLIIFYKKIYHRNYFDKNILMIYFNDIIFILLTKLIINFLETACVSAKLIRRK